MIASRRCASTTPFPPAGGQDVQKPLESGPRWSWAALMRWTASVIAWSTSPMAPAIPHMSELLLVELEAAIGSRGDATHVPRLRQPRHGEACGGGDSSRFLLALPVAGRVNTLRGCTLAFPSRRRGSGLESCGSIR